MSEPLNDTEFASEIEKLTNPQERGERPKAAPRGIDKAAMGKAVEDEGWRLSDLDREGAPEYSHAAMIDLIVANPNWTHKQYAKHFGQGPGWFASVLAGDQFQLQLDERRSEVRNPALTSTLEERFRALTLRALDVVQAGMDNPKVQDATVLKALELGIKALGMGKAKGDDDENKPKVAGLDALAERLIAMQSANGNGASRPGMEHMTEQQKKQRAAMPSEDVLLMELTEVRDAPTNG